jgi:hypothetical protein
MSLGICLPLRVDVECFETCMIRRAFIRAVSDASIGYIVSLPGIQPAKDTGGSDVGRIKLEQLSAL